jgi:hypothetical protein
MEKSVRATVEEINAFLRACEKNGIAVSEKPDYKKRRAPIIVDKDGQKYSISAAMVIRPLPAGAPPMACAGLGRSAVKTKRASCVPVKKSPQHQQG